MKLSIAGRCIIQTLPSTLGILLLLECTPMAATEKKALRESPRREKQASGQLENTARYGQVRRDIARIMTVQNERKSQQEQGS